MRAREVEIGQAFIVNRTGVEFVRVKPIEGVVQHQLTVSVLPVDNPNAMMLHIDDDEPVKITENVNCLRGMVCPSCGSLGPFMICVRAWCEMHDSGAEEYTEPEWEDGDHCRCKECDFSGNAGEFIPKNLN